MDNRKPAATPYIAAAMVIAAAIWTTIGGPQGNGTPVTHQYARR
jgi:hypothetical protein